MNDQISEYLDRYPEDVQALFHRLRALLPEGALTETLWARLPSYYAGKAFVRLIPFKDHINVEAAAIPRHSDELAGFRLTPKGMLVLSVGSAVPEDVLRRIFAETLAGSDSPGQ